ncbi:TIGR00341 family protein [soil metagenome]
MQNILNKISLHYDQEEYEIVIGSITKGVVFKGTNLWILIFAVFIASLGLNVNSTAVIIGAMLISPLMGPIMGIGLGMGINDTSLIKKSAYNYFIATFAALITSTIFFFISPLNAAHSEILARTSPSIYDVLIALFGGLAGIIATSSKQKGNVIPGVAIATALMPPLCTAGYGLANLEFNYFIGAFYLYIINTVFIALSTFLIVRFLKFPLRDHTEDAVSHKVVWIVVIITLLPSIYFGYDLVQQNNFKKSVDTFIAKEVNFPNDYLLNKKVDPKDKLITLTFGGREITSVQIDSLKMNMKYYDLADAKLSIKQGFSNLGMSNDNMKKSSDDELTKLSLAIAEKEKNADLIKNKLDSINAQNELSIRVFNELKTQYPKLDSAVIQPSVLITDSLKTKHVMVAILSFRSKIYNSEKTKIEDWLKVRLKADELKLIVKP